jgi:MFS family permease
MSNSEQNNNLSEMTRAQRFGLISSTVGGHAFKHLFNAAFFVILPEIKFGLGLTNIQIGTLSTVRNMAGGISNLPAGFIADRFSGKRPEILGVTIILLGVFSALLGTSHSYFWAVLTAALVTSTISFWHPAAISTLSQFFNTRRGFAIAIHGTGGSVGEVLGPIVAGTLIGVLSWRTVLQGSAVPALFAGVLIWASLRFALRKGESPSTVKSYLRSFINLMKNRRLLLLLMLAGGFSGGQSAVLTFLPIYLREELTISSFHLGLYLSLAQLAGIGSQPIMGFLSDKYGRKAVLAPGLLGLGCSFLGLYLVPFGWPFIVVIFIMGIFLFPMMAILLAGAMDLVEPQVQATTVSLVFGSAILLAGLSPAVAGFFADTFGIKSTFLWGAGITLVTSTAAFITKWER